MINLKYSRAILLKERLEELNYQKALKALDFVVENMGAENGCCRKDGSDYYIHLVDVAQDLLNARIFVEDYIVAALLHDSIEDIHWVDYEYVKENYGKAVADIVQLVSKDKSLNYHKDEKAMQEYLDRISENEGAALVKTADRIHNFSSLHYGVSYEHKVRQLKNTEKFFIPFFKKNRNLYPTYSYYFYNAKYFIQPMIYALKEYTELVEKIRDSIPK